MLAQILLNVLRRKIYSITRKTTVNGPHKNHPLYIDYPEQTAEIISLTDIFNCKSGHTKELIIRRRTGEIRYVFLIVLSVSLTLQTRSIFSRKDTRRALFQISPYWAWLLPMQFNCTAHSHYQLLYKRIFLTSINITLDQVDDEENFWSHPE